MKFDVHQRFILIYISFQFHEITLSGYLVRASNGQMAGRTEWDGKTDGRIDINKTISLRLWRGIKKNAINFDFNIGVYTYYVRLWC